MTNETGCVIFIGAVRNGVSTRTGNIWASQEFVIETNERSPRKIAFTLFGEEKIQNAALRQGETVQVCGWTESHEYNGNWFTECRVFDILDNGVSRLIATKI